MSTDARENARRMLLELATAEIAGTALPSLRHDVADALAPVNAFLATKVRAGNYGPNSTERTRAVLAYAMSIIVRKRCACGVEISALEWRTLQLVGVQRFDDNEPDLELRNCNACGSTLAVELPRFEPAREVA